MSRYAGGVVFERWIKRFLEVKGFKITRAAGSKGIVDLVARRDGRTYEVQCKSGTTPVSGADWNKLHQWAEAGGNVAVIVSKVKAKKRGADFVDAVIIGRPIGATRGDRLLAGTGWPVLAGLSLKEIVQEAMKDHPESVTPSMLECRPGGCSEVPESQGG